MTDDFGPLLETKLYVPKRRRGLVARPRLRERLSGGSRSKLTLVSAPAGFGKSTLLAEWLAAAPADAPSTAWLSLDPGDDKPASFWPYVIAALQTVAPGVGGRALSLLQGPQQPPIEAVLTTLLNELGAVLDEIVLVLDDYHVIESQEVNDGMAFLLEHLPAQIHVVLATRADPALPLSRLRGSGELTEIRATDLRFTPDEAAAYLNEVMGLDLASRDVAALEGRTEGWIAALQLAALSMQGRDDVAGFIAAFAGDDRYIVDYLVEEVLLRQPGHVRTFLLQTSILGRMTGPLCDAVTGQAGGKAMLETLDRGNLFLVPLDDRRRWYRYHHLFADVLRAHLLDEQGDRVPELHRRASDWYEQNGERSEAINHALAARDLGRAAELVELALPAMRQTRQEAKMLGWLEALPDELIRARPVLSVHYAGTLLLAGQLDGVEARLRDAERWVDTSAGGPTGPGAVAPAVVADPEEFRRLPGSIAVFRAAQALTNGDVAGTMTHARRALDLIDEDDHLGRGAASGLLGLAYWRNGDLEDAHRLYVECSANLETAGYISDVLGCAISLADIRIAQGRLRDAMRTYEQALRRATDLGTPLLRGTADMYVGMSELLLERDDLDGARQHLVMSAESGEYAGLEQNPYRSRLAMARIRAAEGDLDGALDLLLDAERQHVSDFLPDVRPIGALKARVWVGQGRSSDALGWVREQGLSVEADLTYLHEFEHITLARMLLAGMTPGRPDRAIRDAVELLERLLLAAEAGGRIGSVVEILVLLALAHQADGDLRAAIVAIDRAVRLAQPEERIRIFVDAGQPMAVLLGLAVNQRIAPAYVRRLLGAIGRDADHTHANQILMEPLSERELDVLRLLETDLDGPDIAGELVVSLNTVRTHTKNIYAKLGVNSRRAAVRRAVELNLL